MKNNQLLFTIALLLAIGGTSLYSSHNKTTTTNTTQPSPVAQLLKKLQTIEDTTSNKIFAKDKIIKELSMENLKKLVEKNVDLDPYAKKTLLHWTVEYNLPEQTNFLLENGAIIRADNEKGETPFHVAAQNGNVELLKLLIQHVPNVPKAVNTFSLEFSTPLQKAVEGNCKSAHVKPDHLGVVKLLIENGASFDKEIIFEVRDVSILKYFIEKQKISGTTKNGSGETLLHNAILNNAPEAMVEYLLKILNLNPNELDNKGNTPFCNLGYGKNNIANAQQLIKAGANPQQRNSNGEKPFSCIAVNVSYNFIENLPFGLTILDFLIEQGANIEAEDIDGRTCLNRIPYDELASQAVIAYLLKKGAKINHMDYSGKTPLIKALDLKLPEIAHFLLAKGADWTITNNKGENALQVAQVDCPDMIEPLINHVLTELTGYNNVQLPLERPASKKVLETLVKLVSYGRKLPPCTLKLNTLERVVLKFIIAFHRDVPFKKLTLEPEENELCKTHFTMKPRDFDGTIKQQAHLIYMFFKHAQKSSHFKKQFLHDIKITFNK